MNDARLKAVIEAAFDDRANVSPATSGDVRDAVKQALDGLDSGHFRVAEKVDGAWVVHQWLKKAVLLSFRLNDMRRIDGGPGGAAWWDKVPSKFAGWGEKEFAAAGFRAVPGCVVRHSAYIAPGVVLMPCFVNLGAHVGRGHDDRHLGHGRLLRADRPQLPHLGRRRHRRRARAAAGQPGDHRGRLLHRRPLRGRRGRDRRARLGALDGRLLGASTKIIDRATGEVFTGRVPAYSVVVSGTLPGKPLPDGSPGPSLYCAVIVKRVDAQTRAKTSINELLRD